MVAREFADRVLQHNAWRHPLLGDTTLTAMTLTVTLMAMAAVRNPAERDPVPWGFLLALVIALPNLVRRRAPRLVLLVAATALMTYYSFGFPGFSPFLALAVPLFTAAVTGHLRTGSVVAGIVALSGVLARAVEMESMMRALPGSLTDTALLVGSLLLGDAVRARLELRRELAEGVRRAVREAERESERRAMQERLGLARDLHDLLAHGVAVVGVQANVAAELFDIDRPKAREALEAIRTAGDEVLADLGNTIRLLRVGSTTEPVYGLGDVHILVEGTRQAGIDVDLTVSGDERHVRPSVGLTAYRVIQESLTNVIRHSQASRAQVEIFYWRSDLEIRIVDNGVGWHHAGRRDQSVLADEVTSGVYSSATDFASRATRHTVATGVAMAGSVPHHSRGSSDGGVTESRADAPDPRTESATSRSAEPDREPGNGSDPGTGTGTGRGQGNASDPGTGRGQGNASDPGAGRGQGNASEGESGNGPRRGPEGGAASGSWVGLTDGFAGPAAAGRRADLPSGTPAGHGLAGMRERVVALHGRFAAGNGDAGGFMVTAHLPAGL
ncbi:histidine kinase [Actinoplanes sp. NBRC 101535]|uniref:histidine kinase n=1 Tax=Actinoplanes sp. NBRC 101535 TaxID=3032196 RepID=UPI0024A0301B|nr:histidine kinase [Actinoplanes sp. NBRC 101535]GLY04378.1 hypothetical protein Acsp01_47570 [Actinoplanes sp. NBRC 101535]